MRHVRSRLPRSLPVDGKPGGLSSWRLLSAVFAGCLLASGALAGSAAQAADPASGRVSVTASPSGPSEAADEASAMAAAARFGSPVEVLNERTESTQTFAQPDGTFRSVVSATPQRVRRDSGWVDVNPRLHRVGTSVVPQASTLDVRFTADGKGPLVTLKSGDRSIALSWPEGQLKAPTLVDDTAKYEEVLPGVDLELTASADAFSQVLVVKNATAAKNPKLARLQFVLTAKGMSMQQDPDSGFIRVVDPAGTPVFVSDGARMWESPTPVAPAAAPPAGKATTQAAAADSAEALPGRSQDLPVRLTANELTVVPSMAMLTDPSVKYPLFIDPGFNGGKEIWTPVSRKHPGQSYWTDANWRDEMRVGQNWYGSSDDDWRTLVQFNTSILKGTQIVSAAVHVNVWHTADCTKSPLQLWQTNYITKDKAVTWNNTKDKWWKRLAEVSATANKQSCPKGNDEVGFKNDTIRDAFQAQTKGTTITLAFRAKSEADKYQWKKLKAGSTYLDVVYNHKPKAPTGFKFAPCYLACANPLATSAKRPALTMSVADADGGKLRYEYEVYNSTKKTLMAASAKSVTGVASGASRGWTVVKNLADGQYHWRGRGCDAYACGPYSGWITFTVDSNNPNLPSVDSDVYKSTGWNGGPGVPGTFTISPGAATDGVSGYAYALNDAKAVTVPLNTQGPGKNCTWTGQTAQCVIAPSKDMDNVLIVESLDKAGNRSGIKQYPFRVKSIGKTWHWGLDEGAGTIAASDPDNDRPATVTGSGISWEESGAVGDGSATFTGSGELTTGQPVLDTSAPEGITVAAFVRLPAPEPTDDDGADDDTPPGDEPAPGDSDDEGDAPSGEVEDTSLLPEQNQTVVSQDGANASAFRLGYRIDLDLDDDPALDPAWCMTVKATDAAAADEIAACTTVDVTAGEWVHLVGVVDQANDEIRLYVNGLPENVGTRVIAAGKTTWAANGAFAVGRGGVAAKPAERWVGGIDEVYAVPRIWSDVQIDAKAHEPENQLRLAATS